MAITFINMDTTDTAVATRSVVLTKPTNTVDGDLMLSFVFSGFDVTDFPTGWTLLSYATDTNSLVRSTVCYKIANGEGASYTWSTHAANTTTNVGGAIVTYRRAIAVTQEWDSTTTTDPATTPTLVTTNSSKILYYALCRRSTNTALTYTTAAGGVTERFDHGNNGGLASSYSHVLYEKDEAITAPGSNTGISIDANAAPTDRVSRTFALQEILPNPMGRMQVM